MKIILRKQYISYEPNEYEFCGEVTKERIKSDLENFPWEEQIWLFRSDRASDFGSNGATLKDTAII
ncbi:MAG: hypothetical protein Q8O62_05955 [Aequorivita sp.]|nr:hypothetical protein [Aequorivita sp.]